MQKKQHAPDAEGEIPLNGQVTYRHPETGRIVVETYFDPDHEDSASLTKQSMKDECDVNKIVKKYDPRQLEHWMRTPPTSGVYADLTLLPTDLQTALSVVERAHEAMDNLPVELRTKFQNNPQLLIDYLKDPKNNDESIELGLRVSNKPKPDHTLEELKNINSTLQKQNKNSKQNKNQTQHSSDDQD